MLWTHLITFLLKENFWILSTIWPFWENVRKVSANLKNLQLLKFSSFQYNSKVPGKLSSFLKWKVTNRTGDIATYETGWMYQLSQAFFRTENYILQTPLDWPCHQMPPFTKVMACLSFNSTIAKEATTSGKWSAFPQSFACKKDCNFKCLSSNLQRGIWVVTVN